MPNQRKPSNRLAKETSPYLLLHAQNPVDWFPWGDEALAKAKRENKLIFLSVGYSSCHWCHVMERESFCDAEIAGLLNQHFVCVKVDREERPDIDAIYMAALQIYNRSTGNGSGGGWPMSMFLTPESRPFFGGTYFPARDGDRGARVGFLTILQRVQEIWSSQSDRLRADAETLTKLVQTSLDGRQAARTGTGRTTSTGRSAQCLARTVRSTIRRLWIRRGSTSESEIPGAVESAVSCTAAASGGRGATGQGPRSSPAGRNTRTHVDGRNPRSPGWWLPSTVDPDTLRAIAIERLTTGSGPDTELGVSADARRLAFTEELDVSGLGSSPSTPLAAGSTGTARP